MLYTGPRAMDNLGNRDNERRNKENPVGWRRKGCITTSLLHVSHCNHVWDAYIHFPPTSMSVNHINKYTR